MGIGIWLLIISNIILISCVVILLILNFKKQTSIDNLIDDFKYYAFKTLMIKKQMEEVDASGAFEADDYVGKIFKDLRSLVLNLGIDQAEETRLSSEIDRYMEENKIDYVNTETQKK